MLLLPVVFSFGQNKPKDYSTVTQSDPVFRFVEQMPEFAGGMPAMNHYLSDSIRYPSSAYINHIQGRVIVQMVIKSDGRVSDTKIIKGLGYGCDEEAIRVVSQMPKWNPGKQNGTAVDVYYTLPITFKLE